MTQFRAGGGTRIVSARIVLDSEEPGPWPSLYHHRHHLLRRSSVSRHTPAFCCSQSNMGRHDSRSVSPRDKYRDRDRYRDRSRDRDLDKRDPRRSRYDPDEEDRRRSRPTRSRTPESDDERSKRRRDRSRSEERDKKK